MKWSVTNHKRLLLCNTSEKAISRLVDYSDVTSIEKVVSQLKRTYFHYLVSGKFPTESQKLLHCKCKQRQVTEGDDNNVNFI